MAILAEDAVLVANGGGKAAAVRRPLYGTERVAGPLLVKVSRMRPERSQLRVVRGSGDIALLAIGEGSVIAIVSLDPVDDRVVTVSLQFDPDKLERIASASRRNQSSRSLWGTGSTGSGARDGPIDGVLPTGVACEARPGGHRASHEWSGEC